MQIPAYTFLLLSGGMFTLGAVYLAMRRIR